MSTCRFERQKETKEVVLFDGLYLSINIADKQLIQLDHITYDVLEFRLILLDRHTYVLVLLCIVLSHNIHVAEYFYYLVSEIFMIL